MSTVRRLGETSVRTLAHEIQAVHASTGGPVAVSAEFGSQPLPWGYALRQPSPSVAIVTADAAAAAPVAPVQVRLTATDPAAQDRLLTTSVDVVLAAPVITQEFQPAPSLLEVTLVRPDGDPSTGRAVTVEPAAGAAVGLAEDPAAAGVYRSPPTAWTAQFHPLDIHVDGASVRRAVVDVGARTTRIRAVDPT